MENTGLGSKKFTVPRGQLLLCSVLFFVPSLSPQIFGWLNGFLAVPVFYLLTVNGLKPGATQLSISLLIAGLGALLVHRLEIFLFSLTLIPLGYILFKSATTGESAAVSGCKGVIVLGLTWLLFWGLYGAAIDTNPYRYLLEVFDQGVQQSLEFYTSKEAGLSQEMVYNLRQATKDLKDIVPKLLPGLLASALVITVWINMVTCNNLVNRFHNSEFPWGEYSTWRLPEQLVWVPIIAIAVVLVGDGDLRYVGDWILLISGLLYFFQGLSIFIALLQRWNVPIYIRGILYFVLIIQSYGVLILAIIGISDTWFNFRQRIENR